jgi:hypothetical protein
MNSQLSEKHKIDSHVVESQFLMENYTYFSEFMLYCMKYIDKKYNKRYAKIYRKTGKYFVTCIANGKNCRVEYLGVIHDNGEYSLMDVKSMNDEHWEIFHKICEENKNSIENRIQWFDDMNVDAHLEELRF